MPSSSSLQRYLPPLNERNRRWFRFLGVLAGIWIIASIITGLSTVLTPVVIALAIAYILNPTVTWLEQNRGITRLVSVSTGLFLLGCFVVVGLLIGGVQVAGLVSEFSNETSRNRILEPIGNTLNWIATLGDTELSGAETTPGEAEPTTQTDAAGDPSGESLLADNAEDKTGSGGNQPKGEANEGNARRRYIDLPELARTYGVQAASSVSAFITAMFASATYWLTALILIPLYTFFFLLEFNSMVAAVRDHLPRDSRPTVVRIVTTIDRSIAAFFRGRVVVCSIIGFLSGMGWLIVGVKHSLLLGAAAGVLNLVPFLSITVVPAAIIIAYLDNPGSWAMPVTLAAGVYFVVQAIESFVLTPVIESKSSGLHPVTTVIALLVGAQVAGLLGMLLAIPLASTLKSLGAEYVLPEIRRLADHAEAEPKPEAASDPPAADPPSASDSPQGGSDVAG